MAREKLLTDVEEKLQKKIDKNSWLSFNLFSLTMVLITSAGIELSQYLNLSIGYSISIATMFVLSILLFFYTFYKFQEIEVEF